MASRVNRRQFLGWSAAGMTAIAVGGVRGRAHAQAPSYPDWIPASPKPPKKGGAIVRASSWDPPVLDPRHTQSVGLYQFAGIVHNRMARYAFADEISGPSDMSLKGDLAESWQAGPDGRTWTFKIRKGVKWQNVPPLNGRELVAADIKYCYEQYAKEGVQAFTFEAIEGMETPDKHTLGSTSRAELPLRAEPRGADRGHLLQGGPRGGRRPQEADDRHRAVHHEGAHAQGEGRAPAEPGLLRLGAAVRRPVHDPLDAGRRHAAGGIPHGPERHPVAGKPLGSRDGAQDDAEHPGAALSRHAVAVRSRPRAGSPAVQRRARAARHLDGDRPRQAARHGVRGQRHPRDRRAVDLLPGQGTHREGLRTLLGVQARGGQEAPRRGRARQGLRGHAVLLRVLPADDLAGAARAAGPQEEPQHRREDHQARLHQLLREVRRGEVGRHVVGLPVGPRGRARRAHVPLHALEVDEELLPGQRSPDRRALHASCTRRRRRRSSA